MFLRKLNEIGRTERQPQCDQNTVYSNSAKRVEEQVPVGMIQVARKETLKRLDNVVAWLESQISTDRRENRSDIQDLLQ